MVLFKDDKMRISLAFSVSLSILGLRARSISGSLLSDFFSFVVVYAPEYKTQFLFIVKLIKSCRGYCSTVSLSHNFEAILALNVLEGKAAKRYGKISFEEIVDKPSGLQELLLFLSGSDESN